MNFVSTVKGSLLEGFYPEGWDFDRIAECCSHAPEEVTERQDFWNPGFAPISCATVADFDVKMGHEIANRIRMAKEAGRKAAFILPVGPMGMYKWAVYFLREWNVKCDHVWCFNMDEWADGEGNTITGEASFQSAMESAFYGPLGELTVPVDHRNFATKDNLPTYFEKIAALKAEGAELILVYGIGRMCHIAFWEPHFGSEFASDEEWRKQPYRLGAKLHPLTIEQNALTSFRSRTDLVPCRANTVGPALLFQADYAIGGADGAFSRGMQWQGMSFWMTLRYRPTRFVTSSYIPTIPGKLFFLNELAGPLCPDVN
ncbi:MAG: glucosamine-6-phosphate isomerase [Firmicutes bacterium]|uniref:Glucosamine-6-phosphate isomerase n=1 Tax=Candidatus Colimorpha enterica TaxID=3083063 RepID=A0AAE3FEK1_9BACT|nr:glucosamine-6-phosphate isomerase [Candidatus Colimorpha enterica]